MSDTGTLSGPKLRESVAEEIRALMARRRVSRQAMATALGVSHTTVWRRLSGETALDLDELESIAGVLGVTVVELVSRAQAGSVINAEPGGRQTTGPNVEQPKRPMLTGQSKRTMPPPSSRRPARLVPVIAELMPDTPMELLAAGSER